MKAFLCFKILHISGHPGHIYYRWPGYISEFTWYTLYLLDIPWLPQINPFFAIFIALMIFAIFSRLSQLLQPIALFKTKMGVMKWCHIFWIWPEKKFVNFFLRKIYFSFSKPKSSLDFNQSLKRPRKATKGQQPII